MFQRIEAWHDYRPDYVRRCYVAQHASAQLIEYVTGERAANAAQLIEIIDRHWMRIYHILTRPELVATSKML